MEITEVKVFPVQEEKLKAFVSVVIDHCFMVNDIKVIQGREGLFISMPSRRKKNGEFKDVAHPLNNDCRKMIEGRILEQYELALETRGGRPQLESSDDGPVQRSQDTAANGDSGPVRRPRSVENEPPSRAMGQRQPSTAAEQQTLAAAPAESTPPAIEEPKADEEASGKSLKDVEELHLRDSFWTMP